MSALSLHKEATHNKTKVTSAQAEKTKTLQGSEGEEEGGGGRRKEEEEGRAPMAFHSEVQGSGYSAPKHYGNKLGMWQTLPVALSYLFHSFLTQYQTSYSDFKSYHCFMWIKLV